MVMAYVWCLIHRAAGGMILGLQIVSMQLGWRQLSPN